MSLEPPEEAPSSADDEGEDKEAVGVSTIGVLVFIIELEEIGVTGVLLMLAEVLVEAPMVALVECPAELGTRTDSPSDAAALRDHWIEAAASAGEQELVKDLATAILNSVLPERHAKSVIAQLPPLVVTALIRQV